MPSLVKKCLAMIPKEADIFETDSDRINFISIFAQETETRKLANRRYKGVFLKSNTFTVNKINTIYWIKNHSSNLFVL